MHAWLAFFGGVCAVLGILLLAAALSGVTYYGIGFQLQVAVALIALVLAVIAAWMLYAAIHAQYHRVKTGIEALVGAEGLAATDLNPQGTVRVVGEFWQAAAAQNTPIHKGAKVQVIALDGMFLVVKTVEEKA